MEPDELLLEIGDTVRRLPAARGYSQEGFAQAVGLNRAYYGGIERGERNVGGQPEQDRAGAKDEPEQPKVPIGTMTAATRTFSVPRAKML